MAGELVHVVADNCYAGIGLVVSIEKDTAGAAYRVLTSDGKLLYYFPQEVSPLYMHNIEGNWVECAQEAQ